MGCNCKGKGRRAQPDARNAARQARAAERRAAFDAARKALAEGKTLTVTIAEKS